MDKGGEKGRKGGVKKKYKKKKGKKEKREKLPNSHFWLCHCCVVKCSHQFCFFLFASQEPLRVA